MMIMSKYEQDKARTIQSVCKNRCRVGRLSVLYRSGGMRNVERDPYKVEKPDYVR